MSIDKHEENISSLTIGDIAAIKFQSECTLVRAVCRMQPYVLCHDKRAENFCFEIATRNIAIPYLKLKKSK